MQEEQDPLPEYLKSFNAGYTMSQHDPKTLDTLLKGIDPNSDQHKALIAGKKQHELEKIQERSRQGKSKDTEREY
jgi:hypothetical protein